MALRHFLGTCDARLLRVQLMASVFYTKTITFIGILKGKPPLKKLLKAIFKAQFSVALFSDSARVSERTVAGLSLSLERSLHCTHL